MRFSVRTLRMGGFTLIEVVVALAIVALGLIAAFNSVIQIASGASHMQERTLANWVAMNELTRIRLSGSFPDVSQFDGDVEFGTAEYRWRANVSETGVEDLRRIDIEVAYLDTPDVVISTATGFVSPRPPPNPIPTNWLSSGGDRTQPDQSPDADRDSGERRGDEDTGEEDEE